jgi:RNA polymerase sigma factor (sigma-70 family)
MRIRPDARLREIEQLYARRFAHFVRVAHGIVGDRDQATEVVQDAFASVIRARASYRGEGALEAFVWRAVVNEARSAMRRRRVAAGEVTPEAGGPENENPDLPQLAPLVAALPERQRLVVFLRYYADLDYRAIAEALDVEVGTVGATLASAHRAVRKALEEVETHG